MAANVVLQKKITKIKDVGRILMSNEGIESSLIESFSWVSLSPEFKESTRPLDAARISLFRQKANAFAPLAAKFSQLRSNLSSIDARIKEALASIQMSRAHTADAMAESRSLNEMRTSQTKKLQIAQLATTALQIPPAAVRILTSDEGSADEAFYNSLAEIDRVRSNANKLLAVVHGTSLADALSECGEICSRAYEKLFTWVMKDCREATAIHNEDTGEMGRPNDAFVRRALGLLSMHPEYFRQCAREVAKGRSLKLFRRFHVALNYGGPNGNPRPIEFSAFDPTRYVGDMAAWIHQNIAWEVDFATSFVAVQSVPVVTVSDLTDSCTASLVDPFRSRVDATIANIRDLRDCLTLLQISNLMSFFSRTLTKLIGSSSDQCPKVPSVMFELREMAWIRFLQLWESQSLTWPGPNVAEVRSLDNSAPNFVRETSNLLAEMLRVHEQALDEDPEGTSLFGLIDLVVEPMCNRCRQAQFPPDDLGRPIFLVNSFALIQIALTRHPLTSTRVERLAEIIDEELTNLAEMVSQILMKSTGLAKFVEKTAEGTLDAQVDRAPLARALRQLRQFVITGNLVPASSIEKIAQSNFRSQARQQCHQSILRQYQVVHPKAVEWSISLHSIVELEDLLNSTFS